MTLTEILPLRELYRREMNCQIVHDSWHERGETTSYLIKRAGRPAGYGAVDERFEKGTVIEFFMLPAARADALHAFRRVLDLSGARAIRAQTNDLLLTLLLFDCADLVTSETILFADAETTCLSCPAGATFRDVADADRARMFPHRREPVGEWGIEVGGTIVGTCGALTHYNPPYADLHMEVAESHRRKGYGAYLIQEGKRRCYERGKIPTARCNVGNTASRATLQKAGFLPCARVLRGMLSGRSTFAARPTSSV